MNSRQRYVIAAALAIVTIAMSACASLEGLEGPALEGDGATASDPPANPAARADSAASPGACPANMVCIPVGSDAAAEAPSLLADARDVSPVTDALAEASPPPATVPDATNTSDAKSKPEATAPDTSIADAVADPAVPDATKGPYEVCEPVPIDCATLSTAPVGVAWTCQRCSEYVVTNDGSAASYGPFTGCVRAKYPWQPNQLTATLGPLTGVLGCPFPPSTQFECETLDPEECMAPR